MFQNFSLTLPHFHGYSAAWCFAHSYRSLQIAPYICFILLPMQSLIRLLSSHLTNTHSLCQGHTSVMSQSSVLIKHPRFQVHAQHMLEPDFPIPQPSFAKVAKLPPCTCDKTMFHIDCTHAHIPWCLSISSAALPTPLPLCPCCNANLCCDSSERIRNFN